MHNIIIDVVATVRVKICKRHYKTLSEYKINGVQTYIAALYELTNNVNGNIK